MEVNNFETGTVNDDIIHNRTTIRANIKGIGDIAAKLYYTGFIEITYPQLDLEAQKEVIKALRTKLPKDLPSIN